MGRIKNIVVEFYGEIVDSFWSLESLTFSKMLEWEVWCFPSSSDEERLFPCLRVLRMRECPKLVGNLPDSLSSLMKLEIVGRSELTAPLPRGLSLCKLKLGACNEMVLGSSGVDFSSLVALYIGQISNLSHIGEEFMGCLTALENLSIKDCKEVRWLRLEKLGGL